MNRIRIERILLFIGLTFGLSWGFDGFIILLRGVETYRSLGGNPWGMLAPAFSAVVLQMFVFKDSPIHFRAYKEKPRWILLGFLVLTVLYAALTMISVFHPQSGRIFQGVGALLFTLWTLLVFFVAGQSKPDAFERAGLRLGDLKAGPRFVLGIVAFFAVQALANQIFHLGSLQSRAETVYGLPVPPSLYIPSLIVLFIAVAVIGTPLSGLAAVFGEEYGWRGFLQSEWVKAGKVKGVLLVGLIWGVWHFPVILRGMHTYPPSCFGLSLGIIFFVLWGIIQSYAVIKTGSIWIAAFMHGVVNSVYGFMLTYISRPHDNVNSFGLGIYGLVCMAAVVCVILRDPVWKKNS